MLKFALGWFIFGFATFVLAVVVNLRGKTGACITSPYFWLLALALCFLLWPIVLTELAGIL